MSTSADVPAGLMVLLLWTEPDGRVRVRVTRTVDVRSDETTISYASTKAEVLELTKRWLDALVTHW